MIYHDRTLAEPLPARGSVFAIEGAAMLVGALVGAYLERHLPIWLGAAVVLGVSLLTFPRARRLAALGTARWWRAGLLGVLVAGVLLSPFDPRGALLAAVAASLALGEVGVIAATDAPWPRRLTGWRPVFRLSVRLFGVIAAAAVLSDGQFVGIANGSLVAVVLGLLLLPGFLRAPATVEVEGRTVSALRRRCPRCGVPADWPAEGPGTCPACGLVLRLQPTAEDE